MMKKALIAGNFKMFKTNEEACIYAESLVQATRDITNREILICPPFTALPKLDAILKAGGIHLGAQNMHYETEGAFTGEISAGMLKEWGCSHVILGHSERRHKMGESDELIRKKVKTALDSELIPILCVGELEEEREKGITDTVVKTQIEKGLGDVPGNLINRVVIAYEPVWAIGTGKTATPQDANQVHEVIRSVLSTLYSKTVAADMVILYGGSVKPGNIDGLMAEQEIDGVLVGGACLEVESFSEIIHFSTDVPV
jgi:triosephosphate isomerase (TIM)